MIKHITRKTGDGFDVKKINSTIINAKTANNKPQ